MKKIASILLILTVVLTMTVGTAFAATVTVPSDGILKDHSFTAYQVFYGREEGGVLSDVQWGNGINNETFLAALKTDTTFGSEFAGCADAAAVAKVLGNNKDNTELANKVAELAYANKNGTGTVLTSGENTLKDGYYLVVDTTANVGEGGAYNKALLQVVGNINITVKTDAPTLEKKVLEGNSCIDVADYSIGDAVPFRLIGSVPDMSRYDTYKYIFHDTLSAGLTLNEKTIKVFLASDNVGTNKTEITTGWTTNVSGQSFTISFTDLKLVSGVSKGMYIIVEYTATLNQSAEVGLDGNVNIAKLEYSNKPDQSGSGETGNTGNTPEDKVIVFTYELDTTKVDGDDNAIKLQGAEFKLKNKDEKWAIVDTDCKVTGWAESEQGGSTLTSDANGLFKVIGLDEGKYYLKETKAPAGYNLLANEITVVITATTEAVWTDGQASNALTKLEVTADNIKGTGDTSTGIAGITVANNKGATLPETGGIGTTIFYVLGAVLVIGAGVLLVTRRRMNKNN